MQDSHEPGVELNRFCIVTRRLDDQPAFAGALKSPGGDAFLRRGPEPPPHWTKVLADVQCKSSDAGSQAGERQTITVGALAYGVPGRTRPVS